MYEKIKVNLEQGKYADVQNMCTSMESSSIKDLMMSIAYETESICVYSFICYMLNKSREVNWIELAIDIMLHPLCYVEGAYSVALYHARELLEVTRSIKNLERILFFYDIPEKLINQEEAKSIAEEILRMEPSNEVARKVKCKC